MIPTCGLLRAIPISAAMDRNAGEGCDDGNTITEECEYGVEACTPSPRNDGSTVWRRGTEECEYGVQCVLWTVQSRRKTALKSSNHNNNAGHRHGPLW